jgi:hypothetical protein
MLASTVDKLELGYNAPTTARFIADAANAIESASCDGGLQQWGPLDRAVVQKAAQRIVDMCIAGEA